MLPPNAFKTSSKSLSTLFSPSKVLTTIGKKQNKITTETFDHILYPNHITIIGDKAIIGMVWETTIIGYNILLILLEEYIEKAQNTPITTDILRPNNASPKVTN